MKKLMGLFLVCISFFVTSSFSTAASAEQGLVPKLIQTFIFQPTATVWLCPKGARYLLMECKPTESVQPKVELTLDAVGVDADFFQGSWEIQAPKNGVFQSIIVSSFVHEVEGPILLIQAGAGFESDMARHSGVFMDVSQAGVPNQIMTTGDRLPLNETQELALTFELNEIKTR